MIHYQDYGQGLKHVVTIHILAFYMLEMNINDAVVWMITLIMKAL